MAKCPYCGSNISLCYQAKKEFSNLSFMLRKTFSFPPDSLVICNHCGEESRMSGNYWIFSGIFFILVVFGTAFLFSYIARFFNITSEAGYIFAVGIPFIISGLLCHIILWRYLIKLSKIETRGFKKERGNGSNF